MQNFPLYVDSITNVNEKTSLSDILQEIKNGEWELDPIRPWNYEKNKRGCVRKILKYKNEFYVIALGVLPNKNPPIVKNTNKYEIFWISEDNHIQKGGFIPNISQQTHTPLNDLFGKSFYNQKITDVERGIVKSGEGKNYDAIVEFASTFLGSNDAKYASKIVMNIDDLYQKERENSTSKTNTLQTISNQIIPTNIVKENNNLSRNIILFGPPGVGKSYIVDKYMIPKLIKENTPKHNVERITITPSTTYEDFFGCYKPQMNDNDIIYDFSEGVFCRLLKKAFKNPDQNFVLVVEELNRADVYEVFGQVFQLLDRNDDGRSTNENSMPKDAQQYFKEIEELKNVYINPNKNNNEEIDYKLWIPKNMYIICTMNSADQGVHMLDTAFKRRFEMVYVDIEGIVYAPKNIPLDTSNVNVAVIDLPDLSCEQYHTVRKKINKILKDDDYIAEDKLLSEYFLRTNHTKQGDFSDGRDVSAVEFIVKVLGYLLQNVYKSRPVSTDIFNEDLMKDGKKVTILKLLKQNSWDEILNSEIAKLVTNKEE